MKRHTMTWPLMILTIAAVLLFLLPVTVGLPQGQGGSGSGGGGGGGETTVGNNLSYPANFFSNSLQSGTIGLYKLGAQFPNGMSYGCAVPETIGTTTYPNTSCVDSAGVPLPYEACVAKCAGATVERIYWQKNSSNAWQAGYTVATDEAGTSLSLPVEYIDWGDNLEGKSWPVGALRVETNTFSTLPPLPDPYVEENNARLRFNLWHVLGQGTNELWGVHATNADPPVPYVYLDEADSINWPYGVNVSSAARLNIAKLQAGGAACPAAGTGATQSPFQGNNNLIWFLDQTTKTGHWTNAPYSTDVLYGAELNIKGSYVYGYNWRLDQEPVPVEVGKTGWWRLTFYTPDGSIDFRSLVNPTKAGDNALAPPPDITPAPIIDTGTITPAAEEGGDTGLLYVPQVMVDSSSGTNLTYLDICITGGSGGGGGSGSGGSGSSNHGSGGGGGVTGTVTPQGVANGIGGGVGKGVGGGRTGGIGQGRGGGRDLH